MGFDHKAGVPLVEGVGVGVSGSAVRIGEKMPTHGCGGTGSSAGNAHVLKGDGGSSAGLKGGLVVPIAVIVDDKIVSI